MTTPRQTYPSRESRLPYSNLEVVTSPPAQTHPQAGYDDGLQYRYDYVPYTDPTKKDASDAEAIPVENYPNPAPFVRAHSPNEKIAIPPHLPPGATPELEEYHKTHPTIFGIRRRAFWIVLGVVVVILIAAAVGGGVGSAVANRNKKDKLTVTTTDDSQTPTPSGSPSPRNRVEYGNMNIAAVRWEEQGVRNFRVFFQPSYLNDTRILESSWSSNTATWVVSPITDRRTKIKPNAPLAAAAGIPHTDPNRLLTKSVYYPLENDFIIERQSPLSEKEIGKWGDNIMSNKFTVSDNTSMFAYWWADFSERATIIAMFYQELGENSLSLAAIVEHLDEVNSNDHFWENVRHGISIQDGSPLFAAPRNRDHDVVLYMAAGDGTMQQLPVDLEVMTIGTPVDMGYTLTPHNPLCVATEDNTNYYTSITLPECALVDPYSHLILFATEDRQSLTLVSWNCSSGFVDATDRIQDLLKPDRTYLSLTTASEIGGGTGNTTLPFEDQRVYVLYDEGEGPVMEEWQIPDSGRKGNTRGQNGKWILRGEVPIKPI